MQGQNRHFIHTHNLTVHQIPEGTDITCSGCNFPATANVYACWQCNFFLHEQCFRASRSLQHPSHPSHPLTLLPFPTYPSKSFYCNSCTQIGTGFTYSCSACEFDLHVHCAYSVCIPNAEPFPSLNATKGISNADTLSSTYQVQTQGIMHFSHHHALCLVNPKSDEDSTQCSACEEVISDSRYSCSESSCDFHLDKSCFHLSQEIQHKSHPAHPLVLVYRPYVENGFGCNACSNDGTGFSYHCSTCKFDLHIRCASLPEIVKRDDHEHPIKLVYSCPVKGQEYSFICDVCHGIVQENCWTYYCEMCNYGTHVDCVNCEENQVKASGEEELNSSSVNDVLETQLQMQTLQLQSIMAAQNASMMTQFQTGMAQQNANMTMSMGQRFHTSSSHIRDSIGGKKK